MIRQAQGRLIDETAFVRRIAQTVTAGNSVGAKGQQICASSASEIFLGRLSSIESLDGLKPRGITGLSPRSRSVGARLARRRGRDGNVGA